LMPRTLRVATLNVWFGSKLQDARTDALIEVIKSMALDVCCLQEVLPQVASSIVSALPGWSCSDPGDGSTVAPYGVMTLVSPGIDAAFEFHDMPTTMCRKLLVARLPGLIVGTVHLESLANHPTRVEQLRRCQHALAQHPDVLLVGDFNFDSQRNFSSPHLPLENDALLHVMPDFVDVWPSLHREPGYTFDSAVNPYITQSEHMRYDRVMARLESWHVQAIEMFGHEPVDCFRQLSAREREYANQPPTPPRPKIRQRPSPTFELDSPRDSEQSLSISRPISLQADPQARASSPEVRSKFFLSDHFGLVVTLSPMVS